jgi:hypothetical protein
MVRVKIDREITMKNFKFLNTASRKPDINKYYNGPRKNRGTIKDQIEDKIEQIQADLEELKKSIKDEDEVLEFAAVKVHGSQLLVLLDSDLEIKCYGSAISGDSQGHYHISNAFYVQDCRSYKDFHSAMMSDKDPVLYKCNDNLVVPMACVDNHYTHHIKQKDNEYITKLYKKAIGE